MSFPGRRLDVYDNGNGSMQLAWAQLTTPAPDSYNVYLNNVLNQNVASLRATVTGLHGASYNGATITAPGTYQFRVVPVKTGVEVGGSAERTITAQPTSVMLTTRMRRPFPFPNTGIE